MAFNHIIPNVIGQASSSTNNPPPQPISYGNNAILTDSQIANITFNETASLSGPDIDQVRKTIIAAVLNADETLGANRMATASTASDVISRQLSPKKSRTGVE